MEIAILGWGSLVWNPGQLPLASDWRKGGPVLSIEFSRISSNGRLTLVLDELNGVPVTTRYATSQSASLEVAIEDLRKREGTAKKWIGFVDTLTGQYSCSASNNPKVCRLIETWAIGHDYDAVVWTALPSNFSDKLDKPFSVARASQYLQSLSGEELERAQQYLCKAPEEVDTPLRRVFMKIQSGDSLGG